MKQRIAVIALILFIAAISLLLSTKDENKSSLTSPSTSALPSW
jgi:hypothetical protein